MKSNGPQKKRTTVKGSLLVSSFPIEGKEEDRKIS